MKLSEKELLRLALAEHAFREADALARYILDTKISPDSHLFSAAVAGVVVCYCRPFTSGSGIGALPPGMAEFIGVQNHRELQETHNLLVDARNRMAAHFDRTYNEEQHKSGVLPLPPSEIRLQLLDQGLMVTTNAAYLSPDRLRLAPTLFSFQIQRITARLMEFAGELYLKHKRREFILTVQD